MKSVIVEGYVLYKNEIVRIENLGGIDGDFILFNPDMKNGFFHYKLQATEKVFLRRLNSIELIELSEFDNKFLMINSSEDVIAGSDDLRPEFVGYVLNNLQVESSSNRNLEILN